jgi:ubiquitin
LLRYIKIIDKCKISSCNWPKLQITHCSIKNNSKALGVCQNNNFIPVIKFRQNI